MKYSSLPQNPRKRRVILVVSEQDLRELEYDASEDKQSRELLYKDSISLINIDSLTDTLEDDILLKQLNSSGDLLSSGNLLVQSPYNFSEYFETSKAYYGLARKKWDIFTNLWGYLGAKEASVNLKEIQIINSNDQLGISGAWNKLGLGAQGEKDASKKVKQEMNLKKNWKTQGKLMPDKAREYIRKYQWLFSDYEFEAIIDQCELGNPPDQSYTMNVTKESQTNLKLALNLNIPPSVKLNVDFSRVRNEIHDFTLATDVQFW